MRVKKIGCLALSILCALSLGACSSAGDPFNEEGLKKYAEGAYAEAVAIFDKAIAADNQEEEFLVNKGMAYLELEDYVSAHKAFEGALKLEGDCQAAYRGNGIAYMEEGDYESAMKAFELALSCKSGKVSETEYDILLYRGETQTRMGDYTGAVETYSVLLDTQGKKPMTYYLRGIAKVKGGEFEEGMEDMNTAISLDKNNYDMYWEKRNDNSLETGTGVFNGETGTITNINEKEKTIRVKFDDEKVCWYPYNELEQLEHSYCITIHKAQGSEFDVVIMLAPQAAPMLLTRNLLYTGITRAKKLLIVVGNDRVVEYMIKNVDSKKRNTGLKFKLG